VEVDAISGATFTSQGIIDAVNDALQEFAVAAGDTGVNMADIADGTYIPDLPLVLMGRWR
jgi:Na+-transporting NADH:ubiquinone oxidoreductase subunit NqrC